MRIYNQPIQNNSRCSRNSNLDYFRGPHCLVVALLSLVAKTTGVMVIIVLEFLRILSVTAQVSSQKFSSLHINFIMINLRFEQNADRNDGNSSAPGGSKKSRMKWTRSRESRDQYDSPTRQRSCYREIVRNMMSTSDYNRELGRPSLIQTTMHTSPSGLPFHKQVHIITLAYQYRSVDWYSCLDYPS